MDKCKCSFCGTIYDPAKGTPFEELPDDWQCPVCGSGKEKLRKME